MGGRKGKGGIVPLLLLGGGAAALIAAASAAKASEPPKKQPTPKPPVKPPAKQPAPTSIAAKYADAFGVPESLVLAVAQVQSGSNWNAVNNSPRAKKLGGMWGWGQMSLAQAKDLTAANPAVAAKYWPNWDGTGKGLLDPNVNAAMTAFTLSINWKRYVGKVADPWLTAGLAHHQGRGNVDKFVVSHKRADKKKGVNAAQLPPNGKTTWERLVKAADAAPIQSALARDVKKFGNKLS